MSVLSGFGINYKAVQANWASDIAYFNKIGITNIRPNINGTPVPWNSTSLATLRLCAQTFHNAGFWVTWGVSGIAASGGSTLTSSNYQGFHDSVIAEVVYLQNQGIIIDEFELGNELEGMNAIQIVISSLSQKEGIATVTTQVNHNFITGESVTIYNAIPTGYNGNFSITVTGTRTFTYPVSASLTTPATGVLRCYSISISQLHDNLRQLAIDVKAVYNLGLISYACTNNTVDGVQTYSEWIANGLGGLDTISIHPYGTINISTQTVSPNGFSLIAGMMAAFGSQCYISEFNLDSTSNNVTALKPTVAVSTMSSFLNTYIIGNNVQRYLIYSYVGLNNTDNQFAQLYTNGSMNPMWFVFFNSNPTEYAAGTRANINRTSVTRTTVASRTSYPARPLFNS